MSLNPEVPIVMCDARDRESVRNVLVSLVRYVMASTGQADRAAL